MNKKEEIFKNNIPSFPEKNLILKAIEEYGKYCAEEAWREAIQQHSMLSLSNMVNGGFVMKSPDEWWSEFQRKEEQK